MSLLLLFALAVTTIPAAEIEKLIADGKAGEAMQQGRAAVKERPDDIDARLALARALAANARKVSRVIGGTLSKEDIARGQAVLTGFDLSAAPTRVEYDQPLLEEAVLHLNFAISKAPKREDLRVFQCFLFTDAGRIDRARVAITSAVAILPKTEASANTMTSYGVERAKRGDLQGAVTLLAPVAEAFPQNAAVLVDYGNVLTRIGRKADAYAALDRATALAPKELRYARTKAIGAMLLRDYSRARAAFDAAFRLSRVAADEFASFAAAYGADPKSGASLMRAFARPAAPEDAAVSELALAFARAGTSGAGSEDAMTLARNLTEAQQFVLAIPVLDRVVKANPGNAEAKTMLKTTYRELGCESLAK